MPYVTVADFRNLGVPDPPTDAQIQAAITLCESFIDRACRQWFESRQLDFFFDGTDSDAIHLGVPIIDIDFLRINGNTSFLNSASNNLDPEFYRVYSSNDGMMDDRRNPRIKLVGDQHRDIYTAPLQYGRLLFRKGRQNQRIAGQFGFVEPGGVTPPLIVRAVQKLVIEKLASPVFGTSPITPPSGGGSGVVVEESTDDHRIKFAVSQLTPKRAGLSGFTQDQEVLDIIKLYKNPIGLATPAHWTTVQVA